MANALFDNYKNLLLGNGTHTLPDLDTDTLGTMLLDTADHTVDLAADIDYNDITSGGIVATATPGSVTVGSVAAGVFDHGTVTFSTVSGDTCEEVLYYADTGTPANDVLICRFDTFSAGMPVTPNGGDIDLEPNASGVIVL